MDKIDFKNNQEPDLSAETLNQMQTNIENAINEVIDSYEKSEIKCIKFSDGTLIQYGNVSISPLEDRLHGGLTYYSGNVEISLPEGFIDKNYNLSSNILIANMNYFCQSYCSIISNSSIVINFASTGKGDTRTIQWIAVGRWKQY